MRITGIIVCVIVFGCKPESPKEDLFSSGSELGEVEKRLEEASGLAASITHPGLLWTLNDNGNPPEVYLIDQHAQIRLTCKLPNLRNRDWEDIALGAGPEKGKHYVYVGDIGDNDAQYDLKIIYRFMEPVEIEEKTITINQYDTLLFRMPDGSRDAETLLIDPLSHDLFIVSKRENEVALYRSPFPFSRDTTTLEKAATLPLRSIVGGSVSFDGSEVLLKNYSDIFYWKKTGNETLAQMLVKEPVVLDYKREPQGEAIAWSGDGKEFYTLSESKGNRANLIVYKRKK